jgi:glycosyltransferase involved in cell wall biosynthesis
LTNHPSISILLPFRNAAVTLEECLDSIQAQTFSHCELLAVNDRSTDESAAIVNSYAAADSRISLIENHGQGLVAALNTGLRQAVAPLIARMDADDRMHPQRLARQHAHLQRNPHIRLLGCRANPFPSETISTGVSTCVGRMPV